MRCLAIDTESTGLHLRAGDQPFAIGCCDNKGKTWTWEFPVDPKTRKVIYHDSLCAEVKDLFFNYDFFVFHNALFDIRGLLAIGCKFLTWGHVHDTMLMSHVVNSQDPRGLKPLALLHLDILDTDESDLRAQVKHCRRVAEKKGWKIGDSVGADYWLPKALDPSNTLCADYLRTDTIRTMRLFLLYNKLLDEIRDGKGRQHYEELRALLPVVYDMESAGVPIHHKRLHSTLRIFNKTKRSAEAQLRQVAKNCGLATAPNTAWNPNSTQQLSSLLYGKHRGLSFPILATTVGGSPSVNAATLDLLQKHAVTPARKKTLKLLGELRNSDSTIRYLQSYSDLARCSPCGKFSLLYPSFWIVGTATTRFSSSNPNLQNVSTQDDQPLRAVFGPRPGTFWYDIDYDSLELRIFAHAAKEQSLLDAFAAGKDIHGYVASRLFDLPPEKISKNQRKLAKNVNFGLIYGAGPDKITALTGDPNAHEKYRALFPSIDKYMRKVIASAAKTGYVETLFGYPLEVPHSAPYAGVNYIVQGTAGQICRRAMIDLHKFFPNGYRMGRRLKGHRLLLNIHDELIIECPESNLKYHPNLSDICRLMRGPGRSIGIETPVSPTVITERWDQPTLLPKA